MIELQGCQGLQQLVRARSLPPAASVGVAGLHLYALGGTMSRAPFPCGCSGQELGRFLSRGGEAGSFQAPAAAGQAGSAQRCGMQQHHALDPHLLWLKCMDCTDGVSDVCA
jgi:hypothetical protein